MIQAGAKVGVVVELAGAVTATRAGKERPLTNGADVSGDDRIATGADGKIVIELAHKNGARWSLGANKQGTVSETVAWSLPKATGPAAQRRQTPRRPGGHTSAPRRPRSPRRPAPPGTAGTGWPTAGSRRRSAAAGAPDRLRPWWPRRPRRAARLPKPRRRPAEPDRARFDRHDGRGGGGGQGAGYGGSAPKAAPRPLSAPPKDKSAELDEVLGGKGGGGASAPGRPAGSSGDPAVAPSNLQARVAVLRRDAALRACLGTVEAVEKLAIACERARARSRAPQGLEDDAARACLDKRLATSKLPAGSYRFSVEVVSGAACCSALLRQLEPRRVRQES